MAAAANTRPAATSAAPAGLRLPMMHKTMISGIARIRNQVNTNGRFQTITPPGAGDHIGFAPALSLLPPPVPDRPLPRAARRAGRRNAPAAPAGAPAPGLARFPVLIRCSAARAGGGGR